jgi:2'-5' RNA ligase
MTMRLFAAVELPDDVLEDLAEQVGPRAEAGTDIRWTDPAQWHLTLAFMESVPDHCVDDLVERMGVACARRSPFTLSLLGAGAFPNPYAARVLWAGVADESAALPPLARSLRNAAAKAGAPPDGARFHPHVTLGRFRRPTEATRWIRTFDAYVSPEFRVTSVGLVESHLGEGRRRRPRHEVVARFPLG